MYLFTLYFNFKPLLNFKTINTDLGIKYVFGTPYTFWGYTNLYATLFKAGAIRQYKSTKEP